MRFNIRSLKQKIRRYKSIQLILKTVQKWQQDECRERAAAATYYTFFSLFPFILVVLSCLSIFVDPETNTFKQILTYAEQALPVEAFNIFENTLIQFSRDRETAGILGFVFLLVSGSRFLDSLDRTFDTIWGVQQRSPRAPRWIFVIVDFLFRKLLAVGLVIILVAILYLAPLIEIVIGILMSIMATFSNYIDFMAIDQVTFLTTTESIMSFVLLALVLMAVFKILPSARVAWGDVWLGGVITATVFRLLRYLISSGIISLSRNFQSYGVVGSVMVLILWLHLTSQILFLGGEFTFFYARLYGSRRFRRHNHQSVN